MREQREPGRHAVTSEGRGAGASADEIASRASASAAKLVRRAENAGLVARAYEQGALGERATAEALAPLTAAGWHVLHDRLLPSGGNIDHVVVGPAGIVVIDTKNWSGNPSIGGRGELRVDGRSRQAQVTRLVDVAKGVGDVLTSGGVSAPVHAVLVLAAEHTAAFPAKMLTAGPRVVGVHEVVKALRELPEACTVSEVDALTAEVLAKFPSAKAGASVAVPDVGEDDPPVGRIFYKGNVILFVEPWSRSGHRRLYLKDDSGRTLGYRDLSSDAVVVEDAEHVELVEGVLRDVRDGRVRLGLPHLPKIPTGLPGGRLLGKLGLWRNFVVAHHWRGSGQDRLYVTHAVPGQGIFDLGYVDLKRGSIHPTSDEPLGKDLGPPRRYLKVALERYPRRSV